MSKGGFIQDHSSDRTLYAFIASLGIHVLLVLLFQYIDEHKSDSKQDRPMEIVLLDKKSSNQPMMVQTPDQPESKIKPKKEVQFKSNQTHRTEIETFKKPEFQPKLQANISSGGNKGTDKKSEGTDKEQNKEVKSTNDEGWKVAEENDSRKPLQLPGFASNSSRPTIPAYVQQQLPPGVRLGNITSLNTDQHRFYSFNQRLLTRFVPLWGNRVRRALYQWLEANNAPPISKAWVTNVEIIMNAKGEILDVQPFRLSGLWSIDNAAIDSFKQIKNVPNPPEEMVDENGYIHLQFQTEVLWVPQPGVRYHGGGPDN